MTEAVIDRNLNMFRNRAVVSAVNTGKWEYRIGEYREREDYVMLTDWEAMPDGMAFNTSKTFFGRMKFTLRRRRKDRPPILNFAPPTDAKPS